MQLSEHLMQGRVHFGFGFQHFILVNEALYRLWGGNVL